MDPAPHIAVQNLSLNTMGDPSPEVLKASVEHVVSASAEAVAMATAILTSAIESVPSMKQANMNPTQPSEKLKSDLNLPKGVSTRDKPVPSLSGRIKDVSVRPVAEGGYSNVWQGTLDEGQLVRGYILAISPLIMAMSGRLRLSVSETSKCKKPQHKGWVHIFPCFLVLTIYVEA
jgi:hypothetical protein